MLEARSRTSTSPGLARGISVSPTSITFSAGPPFGTNLPACQPPSSGDPYLFTWTRGGSWRAPSHHKIQSHVIGKVAQSLPTQVAGTWSRRFDDSPLSVLHRRRISP